MDVFKLCWRDVAELAEQATVVEPVDPFEGGEFEVVEAPPGPLVANQFGLVETANIVSARALSQESPRDPTELTTPNSASRSV